MRGYNPLKVVGTWAIPVPPGTIEILEGRIDGEFFSQTDDSPDWTRETDGHGNATRVRQNKTGGSFTVVISASSPTNRALSRANVEDTISESVVGPMVLKDLNGETVGEFDDVFLEGKPGLVYGMERGSRAWTFQYGSARVFIDGHDTVGG